MIKITPAAAAQIKNSAKQGQLEGLTLRVAATKKEDGSIHYGMGFDDKKEDDLTFMSEGVDVIVAPVSVELLKDTEIDFVELEPGKPEFIFKNPNDPEHKPVQ